jgi:RNA polymerase sigma-70 factor (ECF subfamily)
VPPAAFDTDLLLDRTAAGDRSARQALLDRHRGRLRQMVAVRLDPRLAARVDPSDVVQEALVDADRKLAAYLRDRRIPFYPWLRRVAWERLAKVHERHTAGRRDVGREAVAPALSDASVRELAGRLLAPGPSPSQLAERRELFGRARAALRRLSDRDREVLVLRYLEHLTTAEAAAVMGVTEGAVKLRHLRALERLRDLMGGDEKEANR